MRRLALALLLAPVLSGLLAGCGAPPRERGILGLPAPGLPAKPTARGETAARGFLGLRVGEASAAGLDDLAEATGLPVELVVEGGPADLAGMKAGDQVLALDGEPVRWRDAFENREGALDPETRAVLTVRRGDGVSSVALEVGRLRRPRPFPQPQAIVEEKLAGVAVRGVPEPRARALRLHAGAGVEVVGLAAKSPWRDAIRPGDVIARAGGKDLFSPRELLLAVEAAGPGGELHVEGFRGKAEPLAADLPLRAPGRVRDLNLAYLFRVERDDDSTDVSFLLYCFRYRRGAKESRVNLLWLFSFAWAGDDETLTRIR